MSISSSVSALSGTLSALAAAGPRAPASQKAGARPISFVMVDMAQTTVAPVKVSLIIRPEELTRTDVSRLTVQQTLGGAWVDDFGTGLATINISGHTGWRGNAAADGMGQFAILKNQVFTGWHRRRDTAVRAGIDPRGVELRFVDALDSTVDVVAPVSFTLRRSRSRPLLMQFHIAMLVVAGKSYTAPPVTAPNPLDSLLSSIGKLLDAARNIVHFVKGIVGQVTAYMQAATRIFQAASNLIASAKAIPQSLLGAARAMAAAGACMFATIAAAAGNSTVQTAAAMSTAAEFSNVHCLLHNAVNRQQTYPDYTPLYGASNCSSTNGGSPVSPYAHTNPFYAVAGVPQNAATPAVTMTPAAQQSLALIAHSDPVLAPMSIVSLGVAAGIAAAGTSVK